MNTEDLYRLLRTGQVQLQGIVDTIVEPMLVLDEGLCVLSASRAFLETFEVNGHETIGRPLYELGNGQWDIPDLRRLLGVVIPQASAVIDYQVTHEFPGIGKRTMLVTARVLHQTDHNSHSMLLTINDVTDRHRRQAAQDVVIGELRHRMKNLLGVTQAIARLTNAEGRSGIEFRDEFLGRFGALIDAHELVFEGGAGVDLRALCERILAPFGDAHVIIAGGPTVALQRRVITSLALALHELATNAAKHGALSADSGQVHVSWSVLDGRLLFRWIESGGPAVSEPVSTGYGTHVIKSALSFGTGGHVAQKFEPAGLRVEVSLPLSA